MAPKQIEDTLRKWVEAETHGKTVEWSVISGGNRCLSWAVDSRRADGSEEKLYLRYQPPRPPSVEPYTVPREAAIYQIIDGTDVPAPRTIAIHPDLPAILTERVPGRADFRRMENPAEKMAIAGDFIAALCKLHALKADLSAIMPQGAETIEDCVRAEIAIWRAMYEETGRRDALIEFALFWLSGNVPETGLPPVLVHGDAGQGNFLFENGRMTALLDWELAHPGDPMEDLAWFSMRSVMEPVPDFAACLENYDRTSAHRVDRRRVEYHRVFVSTRVIIIRHRNVTGEPGNSIVSRALNRRLLVDALADATGVRLPVQDPAEASATPQTGLYDHVLNDLRESSAAHDVGWRFASAAKNAAKVLKYLREVDRLGPALAEADRRSKQDLLGEAGDGDEIALCNAIESGRVTFESALGFFAGLVAREAQLAALASGGLANRKFPELAKRKNST